MKRYVKKIMLLFTVGVILVSVFTSCNKSEIKSSNNTSDELTWYLCGAEPVNSQVVIQKFNELIKDKIGLSVNIVFIEPGNYDQRLNLIISAGEEYDICWTSSWRNNFTRNARGGAYLVLDKYLEKFPALKNSMPETVWEASKVDGKTYGIFNYQMLSLPHAVWFKKDIVEKYGINVDNINSFDDLTKIFDIVKKKEPDIVPIKYGEPFVSYALEMQKQGIIRKKDFIIDMENKEVESYSKVSEGILKHYQLMRDWYLKGYFPANISTVSEADTSLEKAGKLFSSVTGYKPGVEAELKGLYGFDVIVKKLGEPPMIEELYSTLNAVSITSKKPEKALQLLELVNTNPAIYNLLVFGIEGQDYSRLDESYIRKIPDTYQFDAWQIGNQFNAYLVEGQNKDTWEETKKINENVTIHPLAKFQFNQSPIEAELAQINAINSEFKTIFQNGLEEPEIVLEEYKYKLKQAGIDKVKFELQKQLSNWSGN